LGIVSNNLFSVWDWEKQQNLFVVDMPLNITFAHFSYSKLLLGDSSGTVAMCDASSFKRTVAKQVACAVVVIPHNEEMYQDSTLVAGISNHFLGIICVGARGGKGDEFLTRINEEFLLNSSSRDILILENAEFSFILR
jgi:thiamine pyrophosphokinase